jgi:uncharacterized membrane protein YhaH (DUF805 family)
MAGYTPGQPVEVPLDAPLYGASFQQAFVRFWRKYGIFSGRASRSEYWWWTLISFIISAVLGVINRAVVGSDDMNLGPYASPGEVVRQSLNVGWRGSLLADIWGLVTLIGTLALTVRRLHDTNRRGWWWFIGWVPLVGWIILLVFLIQGPRPAGARFDRGPAAAPAAGAPGTA